MIISRPNKNPNLFVQMDSVYINNFSYQNIDEKFTELLNKYSTEEVLNYLVARLQVPNIDHNIMKFLYPLFKLPEDVVDNNIDKELEHMIDEYFKNNLNITDTAKAIHVHRNTLLYRIDKIQNYTNLDLRNFEDSMTFKIAWLIRKEHKKKSYH